MLQRASDAIKPMRFIRLTTFLFFAALVAVGLSACDFSDQNYDIAPGDSLAIIGDTEVAVPDTVEYYVQSFTIEKDYSWSVDGAELLATRRQGEFIDVAFNNTGTSTISVESSGQGDNYSGTLAVDVVLTDITDQTGRLGPYSLLSGFLADTDLDQPLSTDTTDTGSEINYTLLAPTNEAFLAEFDTDGSGEIEEDELPDVNTLTDRLEYHVIEESLTSDDISDGATYTTREGSQITFSVDANGTITVDGATVTQADIPVNNGALHGIDTVLEP